MQIYIKTLDGVLFAIEIEELDTIDDLRRRIHDKVGIPKESIRLIFSGKDLIYERKCIDYGIRQDSVVHMVLRRSC